MNAVISSISVNLNDSCEVTLTKIGADELNRQANELRDVIPSYGEKRYAEGDVYKSQLWDVMGRLGHLCHIGFNVPFKTEIRIESRL